MKCSNSTNILQKINMLNICRVANINIMIMFLLQILQIILSTFQMNFHVTMHINMLELKARSHRANFAGAFLER